MRHGFRNGELAEMAAVGRVDASSARIWVRTSRPGTVRVSCRPEADAHAAVEAVLHIPENNPQDNTASLRLPQDAGAPGLMPLTRYRFRAAYADDGRAVGEGRFETPPQTAAETPERFSFAMMSCNQPFDPDGGVNRKSLQMLRAARRCLAEHDVKYILMMGDQIYTDSPQPLSLFNPEYFRRLAPPGRSRIQECSAQEVRRLFQERYRCCWNVPQWQAIQLEYPGYPILDDHDLVDNWGSDPAHQSAQWQAFGEGAMMGYLDYQGTRLGEARTLPRSFHYHFSYGNTATFVMDLRSQRTAGEDGRLYAPFQFEELKQFLDASVEKRVIFIVLSVPAIHLPKTVTKMAKHMTHSGEDFSDRWSSGAHIRDRDRLLRLLYENQLRRPEQKVVLLSGDIHLGCAQEIRWQSGASPFYQLVSSGITHSLGRVMQIGARLLMSLNKDFATVDGRLTGKVDFLKGAGHRTGNPYGGLNLGIVTVETPEPGGAPRLRFSLYGHRGERPFRHFHSVAF